MTQDRYRPSGPFDQIVATKNQNRRLVMDAIFDALAHGPRELSVERIGVLMGDRLPPGYQKHISDIKGLGVFDAEITYASKENGLPPGRHSTWRLRMDRSDADQAMGALERLEAEANHRNRSQGVRDARARSNGKVKEAAPVKDFETVAIVGDDPVSAMAALHEARRDESYALVEAARQYTTRATRMDQQVEGLLAQARELGLHVDEAALRASISPVARDERLEAVALVLPYIDGLERTIARKEEAINKLRVQLTESDKITREVRALRTQNQQLIARQVTH